MSFTLLLVVLLVVSGGIWLGYWIYCRVHHVNIVPPPRIVDYARSFFPVILLVFLIRSFVVEPFKIPSGSMLPTLRVGDFILVNKFAYGLRIPLLGWELTEGKSPQRGDIVVFQYPPNPSVDYIKRVVATPQDTLAFRGNDVVVNKQVVPNKFVDWFSYRNSHGSVQQAKLFLEHVDSHPYRVIYTPNQSGRHISHAIRIPPEEYFVMGDNRDNSNDSRYWGTVPEENILGEAFLVWWSWDGWENAPRWQRLGTLIQ